MVSNTEATLAIFKDFFNPEQEIPPKSKDLIQAVLAIIRLLPEIESLNTRFKLLEVADSIQASRFEKRGWKPERGVLDNDVLVSTLDMAHRSLHLPQIQVVDGQIREFDETKFSGGYILLKGVIRHSYTFSYVLIPGSTLDSIKIWQDGVIEAIDNDHTSSILTEEQAAAITKRLLDHAKPKIELLLKK